MEKKYKSLHTDNDVSAAQYLAELMCIRQANAKKETLPFKFWNTEKWRMPFKQQLLAAHALLKIYDAEVVIATVKRKDAQWIYSLRFPGLNQKLIEEKDRFTKTQAMLEKTDIKEPQIGSSQAPVVPFATENKASRLRKLDE